VGGSGVVLQITKCRPELIGMVLRNKAQQAFAMDCSNFIVIRAKSRLDQSQETISAKEGKRHLVGVTE